METMRTANLLSRQPALICPPVATHCPCLLLGSRAANSISANFTGKLLHTSLHLPLNLDTLKRDQRWFAFLSLSFMFCFLCAFLPVKALLSG